MIKNCGIMIQKLRKEFKSENGVFAAVKSLNLQMNESEIFCLLGHNGSGKTTTINMLNGLMSPTSGTATVYGFDMCSQMTDIRQLLGICPQHDILFPTLSVRVCCHCNYLHHVRSICSFLVV